MSDTKPIDDRELIRRLRALGHKRRPVSRREFLGQGLITGAATVMMPTLFKLLLDPKSARAQAPLCGGSLGGAGMIPFVCFDLGGGASFAGSNVIVGGETGQMQFLSQEAYIKQGLPADQLPSDGFFDTLPQTGVIDPTQELLFHTDSAFLRGIRRRADQTTLDNVNGVVMCARSENDTGNNPHNPMYGIHKAGADGELVTLVGTRSSDSGGKSMAPASMIDPAVRPTRIASRNDAVGLVDTGQLVELLSQADAREVMSAVETISRNKLGKVTEQEAVETLIECGYIKSTDLVVQFGDPGLLDIEVDANIGTIFDAGDLGNREFERTAAVMKLVMNGFAGAGTIELGGYDYHNGTRATGELKDEEAGECIGAVLQYARLLGQQVMIYVLSDGSLDSDGQLDESVAGRGKGSWRGDNSSVASVFTLVYDPAGRPAMPQGPQLGYFRDSGSVETSALPISNNVELLAKSVILNYMALHGRKDDFELLYPNHGLGDINQLVALPNIRA